MKLYKGDCLIESDKIESGSVDLILTDLPYGTVKGLGNSRVAKEKNYNVSEWDVTIDTKKIFEVANRILRKNGKMVLTANQPFTTELISKAIPNLPHCYNMYWDKMHFANCLVANKAPVSYIEDVLVFSKMHQKHDFKGNHPLRPYFKAIMQFIGLNLKQINTKLGHRRAEHTFYIDSTQFSLCTEKTYLELIEVFGINNVEGFREFAELKATDKEYRTELLRKMNYKYPSTFNLWEGKKYKSNILKYKKDYTGHHPTQKPVLLLEDLIKTFSNENDLVVDLTMGSGSTGVACKNTNRDFIGIEMNDEYFKIAEQRINAIKYELF
jgi:site-specific DNA-methyltransferase (adenine-specific)